MKDDPRAYRKYAYADEDMCLKMITRKIKEKFKVSAVESELKGSAKGKQNFSVFKIDISCPKTAQ